MALGRVKCFYRQQGYGFIEQNDGRPVYFHYTGWADGGIPDRSIEGIDVDYDLLETSRGPEATNIRPLGRFGL
ncbi:MAG: cold shock domain-containing protein [Bdellovibrionales bacterium]|nr:cold shock domain-containing protein [Bdellovibrionales bacterium]